MPPVNRACLGIVAQQHDAARLRQAHRVHVQWGEQVLEDSYEEPHMPLLATKVVQHKHRRRRVLVANGRGAPRAADDVARERKLVHTERHRRPARRTQDAHVDTRRSLVEYEHV